MGALSAHLRHWCEAVTSEAAMWLQGSFLIALVVLTATEENVGFLKVNTIKNIIACKKEHNARRDDYDAIRRSETPTTIEGKCFLACIFDKFSVTRDGKFSLESFSKRVGELYQEEADKQGKALQMVKECDKTLTGQNTADKCQFAVKVLECMASYTSRVEVIRDLLKYQKMKTS